MTETELARLRDAWEEAAMKEFAAEAVAALAAVAHEETGRTLRMARESLQQAVEETGGKRNAWYTAAMQRQS